MAADTAKKKKKKKGIEIAGYPVEGISIGGQETCVIFPGLNMAFDIGRCPQRAISQDYLFISHGHMDHIGGLPMYVATRGLYRMKPPTVFVPASIKENVEKLFEAHRAMDQSELKHNLVALNVGEEYEVRKDLKVRAFRTYHAIPSQGYLIYSVRHKLKQEYAGLKGDEIKSLKSSGVEITYPIVMPEVAFTGDTMSDFIDDPENTDVLKARVLVMESRQWRKETSVRSTLTSTRSREGRGLPTSRRSDTSVITVDPRQASHAGEAPLLASSSHPSGIWQRLVGPRGCKLRCYQIYGCRIYVPPASRAISGQAAPRRRSPIAPLEEERLRKMGLGLVEVKVEKEMGGRRRRRRRGRGRRRGQVREEEADAKEEKVGERVLSSPPQPQNGWVPAKNGKGDRPPIRWSALPPPLYGPGVLQL